MPVDRADWSINLEGDSVEIAPVFAGGDVFVVTHHGKLAALDARSGAARWRHDLRDLSSALAVADARLYVLSKAANAPECQLRTFDTANGASLWSWSSARCPAVRGTMADGAVYLTVDGVDDGTGDTRDQDPSRIVALDARTGRPRWSHRFDTAAQLLEPVVEDRTVFVSTSRAELVALNTASGKVRWQVNLEGGNLSGPVAANGLVHVTRTRGYGESAVHSFDGQTGRRRWLYPARDLISTVPVVAAKTIVIVRRDGRVHGLNDQTGRVRWTRDLRDTDPANPGDLFPVSDGATVYVRRGSALHALDADTGRTRWSDPSPPPGTPLAAHNGVVYLSASDGTFSAANG